MQFIHEESDRVDMACVLRYDTRTRPIAIAQLLSAAGRVAFLATLHRQQQQVKVPLGHPVQHAQRRGGRRVGAAARRCEGLLRRWQPRCHVELRRRLAGQVVVHVHGRAQHVGDGRDLETRAEDAVRHAP